MVLGALVAWVAVQPTAADHEPPRLGLEPVGSAGRFFDVELAPGATTSLEARLANAGHAPVEAVAYAADVYSIVNGGFGAELLDDDPSATTSWLDFRPTTVELAPGEGTTLAFSVTVPRDTPPGEYITSIVAESTEPYRGEGEGLEVDQVNRVAVAVAIDVPGERRPELAIGAVGHETVAGHSVVRFEVSNPGNVHLRPAGELRILRDDGTPILETPARMDTVYAGTSTRFEATLARALDPGAYCASLALTDEVARASARAECLPFRVSSDEPTEPAPAASAAGPLSSPGLPEEASPSPILLLIGAVVSVLVLLALIPIAGRRRAD